MAPNLVRHPLRLPLSVEPECSGGLLLLRHVVYFHSGAHIFGDRLSVAHFITKGAEDSCEKRRKTFRNQLLARMVGSSKCTETVLKANLRRKWRGSDLFTPTIRLQPNALISHIYSGAGRGGRTPTRLPSADFESAASASSAIPARHIRARY
jgi:hypothetical protein